MQCSFCSMHALSESAEVPGIYYCRKCLIDRVVNDGPKTAILLKNTNEMEEQKNESRFYYNN